MRYIITKHLYCIDTTQTHIEILNNNENMKLISFNHRIYYGDGNSYISNIVDKVIFETDNEQEFKAKKLELKK